MLLGSFFKVNVYVLPLPTTLYELTARIAQPCAKIDNDILQKLWKEEEYWFHIA
jgi:hypothetical protein